MLLLYNKMESLKRQFKLLKKNQEALTKAVKKLIDVTVEESKIKSVKKDAYEEQDLEYLIEKNRLDIRSKGWLSKNVTK